MEHPVFAPHAASGRRCGSGSSGGSLPVIGPYSPGHGSAHRAGPARPRPPPPPAPRRLPRNPSREAGTERRGRGRRAGPGRAGVAGPRGAAQLRPGTLGSADPARGPGAGRRAHLKHKPQQEEHRQAGDDVRVILQHEFVAQQRRVLVALLANRHGGAAACACRCSLRPAPCSRLLTAAPPPPAGCSAQPRRSRSLGLHFPSHSQYAAARAARKKKKKRKPAR